MEFSRNKFLNGTPQARISSRIIWKMGAMGAAEITLLRRWQRYRFVLKASFGVSWWAQQDSNLRPAD
jgi:hypothetical protein